MCFVKSVEKHAACGPIATLAVEEPEEDISTEKLAEIMSLAVERERSEMDYFAVCCCCCYVRRRKEKEREREAKKAESEMLKRTILFVAVASNFNTIYHLSRRVQSNYD